jgi:flagellar basal-body rod protein FlgB
MIDKIFNIGSNQVVKKVLDYSATRQRVIANNIANVETPGFKAKDVSFEKEFMNALKNNDVERALEIQPSVYETDNISLRNDGNNVDLEKEIVSLEKNRSTFDIFGEIIKRNYRNIRDLFTNLR